MTAGKIESVRIRGFRSLADVELSNLRNANVLIGANGSGKSNVIRFFEMTSWMLRSRRLAEFVALQGGADDQLHRGNRVTPRMEAELALRTEAGRNDYRFALAHAHPDRLVFTAGTDKSFGAHLTSDGSLRFFALVTLLNLPLEMLPNVLLLDEPELGLHPAAVVLVGSMIKALAANRQIIVATQSPLLVDAFDRDEIFVLDLQDGRTTVRRPDADEYRRWLADGFMPGEMWQKNLIGGRP